MRAALDIDLHARKTLKVALIVGLVLTTINQLDAFLKGGATAVASVKTALNLCGPFVVSNLGLPAGKRAEAAGATPPQARTESGLLWSPEQPPDQPLGLACAARG